MILKRKLKQTGRKLSKMFTNTLQIREFAKVKGGKRLPKGNFVLDEKTNHPYLRVSDMRSDGLDLSDIKYISDEVYKQIKRYTVTHDDVYISIAGTIGFVGKIPRHLSGANLTENAAKITDLDKKLIDQDYLVYFLRSREGQFKIKSKTGGSSQPKLAITRTEKIEIPKIPVDQQSKIAAIINNYTNLIENNEKRIKILEEMVQRLYLNKIVNASNKNWDSEHIKDLLESHVGGGWGSENQSDKYTTQAYVIRGTDIPSAKNGDIASIPLRFHPESNLKSRKLEVGDIVFEVSGGSPNQPLGRALLITEEFLDSFGGSVICASFCKRVVPKKDKLIPEILYLSFLEAQKNGEIHSFEIRSTGISNFKWTDYINSITRTTPPKDIQIEFQNFVKPLFAEIALLGRRNFKLQEIRDLLIPQLVTGRKTIKNV
ncbi:MAG: restriction modification system DNA specificity-like protein [Candidatus Roizmanbacteria bacterium GW2011_GWC2_41_7]|uniref:Restriction modification system DNA specificity-like protein n=1 Tax=Candidatus Roizmanbacteria bacterium GW2011_GWC2_41_7 TaxID=1618487 RepID=A0A0G0ZJH6_9BACT|nr:MAG: restriction modification system DNA specificity-like protein [Candidatus Roizmanbacteria bacterium GW2011_GWC2_41_7]KKS40503.1 MAG: restriction modification system DNA specificity-like protein [Candidatus Gottesmanbacteria bacterium GW2011_GWA2_42_16]KKS80694.1 MAG: restriction modification system DNA specificity-like protein [Candidatus Gottesmanbacteria bacterium GW2011_GWC1_43_10]